MKRLGILLFVLTLVGCKSKVDFATQGTLVDKTVVEIINAYNDNTVDFSTSFIRGSANFNNGKQSQNVGVDIRMQKDEIILINIKVIGLSMAKIQLTPTRVQFYEKLNNRYYDGDFEFLSSILGTELDFFKVQNVLLGKTINNLQVKDIQAGIVQGMHKLSQSSGDQIEESYYFKDNDFMLYKEELAQVDQNRSVTITYPNYQDVGQNRVPSEIHIEAKSNNDVQLKIRYDKITFNEELKFTFSIPGNSKNLISQ